MVSAQQPHQQGEHDKRRAADEESDRVSWKKKDAHDLYADDDEGGEGGGAQDHRATDDSPIPVSLVSVEEGRQLEHTPKSGDISWIPKHQHRVALFEVGSDGLDALSTQEVIGLVDAYLVKEDGSAGLPKNQGQEVHHDAEEGGPDEETVLLVFVRLDCRCRFDHGRQVLQDGEDQPYDGPYGSGDRGRDAVVEEKQHDDLLPVRSSPAVRPERVDHRRWEGLAVDLGSHLDRGVLLDRHIAEERGPHHASEIEQRHARVRGAEVTLVREL
mmetsp:Transcript_56126/g.122705  ORF Transcript_56126/g.122705 Transcript_56126/m.122705 type:complete len:271 (+) Transcript_56126:885-1697(+)